MDAYLGYRHTYSVKGMHWELKGVCYLANVMMKRKEGHVGDKANPLIRDVWK